MSLTLSLALVGHILSATIWVGGLFFAHMALRPAAEFLELPQRVRLWHRVLAHFMPWVWTSVLVLPTTGTSIIYFGFGGQSYVGGHVWLMQGIGWVMIVLFLYMFFKPYQRMRTMVREELFPEAGLYMLRIRRVVTINLVLGLTVLTIAVGGRYW